MIATVRRWSPFRGDPMRAYAAARLAKIEQRVLALLTAHEANEAQRIVRETGRYGSR